MNPDLATRIRSARQHACMSQAELAQHLGVHRSCVGHWEGVNKANPGPDRLATLAKLCVVSYEWLATGRGSKTLGHDPGNDIPAAFGKIVDDAQALGLLRAWDVMPSRSRSVLLQLADILASQHQPKRSHADGLLKLDAGYVDRETGLPR